MWTPRRTLAVEGLFYSREAACGARARAALQGPCEEHACGLRVRAADRCRLVRFETYLSEPEMRLSAPGMHD